MRTLHRFRAWCRAVDAAIDKQEQAFVPPLQVSVILATAVMMLFGLVVGAVTLADRLDFAPGMLTAVACSISAAVVSWSAAYRNWLTAQRRLNGQCPHCGFDLRHSPDHCPECGSSVSDADRKHMTVTFTATEAGAVSEATFTKIWLASPTPRHLLSLQRPTTGPSSSQIYLTFDLEPHTTPGRVLSCTLTPHRVHLELTGYFNNRYDNFDIELSIPPDQHESITTSFQNMLHGTGTRLSLDSFPLPRMARPRDSQKSRGRSIH